MYFSRFDHFEFLRGTKRLKIGSGPNRVYMPPRSTRWGNVFAIFFGMILALVPSLGHAQSAVNREYLIKAAYLFNFGRYTQWPEECWPDKEAPFVIGILGSNPFGEALNQIAAEKELQNRKILVLYFKNLGEYRPCQILYVAEDIPSEDRKAVIAQLSNTKVLLVGEKQSFLQEGGMVSFFLEANKVRFGVNLDPLDRNDLKISSKVLKLAAVVKKDGTVQ